MLLKKLIFLLFCFSAGNVLLSQNFIPNGDFEGYSGCPDFLTELDSADYWFNPSTGGGSPEYFNSCANVNYCDVPYNVFGYQNAHSGVGYAGLCLWYEQFPFREYIEVPLISPLVANTAYQIQFYFSLADFCKYNCNNFGVYLSDNPIDSVNNSLSLPYVPQVSNAITNIPDTMNWLLFDGIFMASGGEQYLIIGNFNTNSNTSTTVIDPTSTLTGAYIFIDDVSLTKPDAIEEIDEFNTDHIYPNPCINELTITSKDEIQEVEIYSAIGTLVKSVEVRNEKTIHLSCSALSNGIYFLHLHKKDGTISIARLVIEK